MAKTAQRAVKTEKEITELSNDDKIKEVRVLRAGKLFVGNMTYIDALLTEYDKEVNAVHHLAGATTALLARAESAEARAESAEAQVAKLESDNGMLDRFMDCAAVSEIAWNAAKIAAEIETEAGAANE